MDQVLQKMTGVRGSWELKYNAKKQALLGFKGIGLRTAMTDSGGIPAPTLPTLPRPVAVNKANPTVAFGAYAPQLHHAERHDRAASGGHQELPGRRRPDQ